MLHRSGDSIFTIPLNAGAEVVGTPRHMSVQEDKLQNALARNAIIRYFSSRPYEMRRRAMPTEVIDTSRNLIMECTQGFDQSKLSGFAIYPSYEFHVRVLHPRDHEPVCVLLVDPATRPAINVTINKLIAAGIDLTGKYVVSLDGKHLLGRIISIDGGIAKLDDYRDIDSVAIGVCLLEPRMNNVMFCLRQLVGLNFPRISTQLDMRRFQIIGAKAKFDAVHRFQKDLQSAGPLNCTAGTEIEFGDVLGLGGTSEVKTSYFKRPDFVFHPTGNKTYNLSDEGLNQFGPFDAEFFSKKVPRILVVTPKEFQGQVEVFLRRLQEGIPNSNRFAKGFVRKYHLNDCDIKLVTFDEGSDYSRAYRDAVLGAVAFESFDLALIVIRESFHDLHGERNPYLVTKAALMSQGIPVQEIEIETIRSREQGMQYVLNNFGLSCYSKMGGIPFTIAAMPPIAHELIIGLGSVDLQENRLGNRSRVVGITTIFNADGTYLLSNAAREVAYGQYIEELKESLHSCLDEIGRRNAWQKRDKVRLVFHVFKPLKDSEARAVKSFVASLTDFDVEFAFLTLSHEHPFTIFDANQEGAWDYENKGKKGAFVPGRGIGLRTGNNELLMTLTGPQQVKTPLHGCPTPVLVKLHRESTFSDLNYLAQQVYRFTFLSWRSFFPGTLPVTISYSQLIGRLLGELSMLPNWNPDMLRTKLRTSRWFL
ncbi:hypothetical protein C1G86_1555 [Dehalococcoides mccartyi]|uniref:Protein argonaute n=1 Tax=Dehalococcoides mccartyi TaxID=61435 RepID=A0A328ERN3_9CHLR|nr:hypothetical protein C1G86_1555 [Dehalococcoides mccartyi]